LTPFSADGHRAEWVTADGDHAERFTLTWENEAWTATGQVERERLQYVLRLAPTWHVRQFLLFRDLDEPDLWLALDARHRWGEVNGSYRPDLDGCVDIELAVTPFTPTVPIRRLGLDRLAEGDSAQVRVLHVDVETLAVVALPVRYERTGAASWRRSVLVDAGGPDSARSRATAEREFTVDAHGLVVDEPGHFTRRA
jgi:hypothetical protein